jgi:hypothetical protein
MRLGPRCGERISALNADGWREVLSQGLSYGAGGARPPTLHRRTSSPLPLSDRPTREVLQLSLHRAHGGNLQAASTLPLMHGVPTPRAGL